MLSSLFARKYLFSKKSHSVINIIAVVSALAVAVPVAAMVILLSVFNGLEGLVKGLYNEFDPDVMVLPARGKTFAADSTLDGRLTAWAGVAAYSYILDENALVEYRGGQYLGVVRGVDSNYTRVIPMEKMIREGEFALHFGDIEQGVVGYGMATTLGINPALYDYMNLYAPRRGSFNPMLPLDAYRVEPLLPGSLFVLDAETDSKYVIAPIEFTRRLFDYPGCATGVAVKLAPGVDAEKFAANAAATLGEDFKALTRYQQKASLYRIMRYEKWSVFLISALVLLIASFSIIGSMVMLVIDKREDVRTLVTMGATVRFVRGVFTREGMLIAGAGAALGMVLGMGFSLVQQHFGIIKIASETFLADSYPVILQGGDLLLVAAVFVAVSYIIIRSTVVGMVPKSTIRI